MRHTKIVATIGPASSSDEAIGALIEAGVDVFRLNFSHGSYATHGEMLARIRKAASEADRWIGVLQDLGGPKIRTGALRDGAPLRLNPGDELRIATGDFQGGSGRVSTTYAELARSVRPGDRLLLDDGRIQLHVEATDGTELTTVVIDGGLLGEHKGINAPGVALSSSALTPKDFADLEFGVRAGVDLMALSFVKSAADVLEAREALRKAGAPGLPLVAKLERPEAITRLDEILESSDAVMVARGDLGLEAPLASVPRLQKEVTRMALARGIPVIVATQVLESMIAAPRPTRAEVSDAANAVDDGVDAIMLAGETAVGEYPVRAVQTLAGVMTDAERIPPVGAVRLGSRSRFSGHGRAICEAAVTLAEKGEASAIVAITHGGSTARALSALRPKAPIHAVTNRLEVARRLALFRGVVPSLADVGDDANAAVVRVCARLVERGDVAPNSVIVVVSISADLAAGSSNFLKLQRV
jgi:pyruvate kinase